QAALGVHGTHRGRLGPGAQRLGQGQRAGGVGGPVDERHLDDLAADDPAAGRRRVLDHLGVADADAIALEHAALDLAGRDRVDDQRLQVPPAVGLLRDLGADAGGDAGVLLAHVGARAKPLRHGLLQPVRVADLLVEVEVGAGGAAVHDQVTVLVALRLDNLGVDAGRLTHWPAPPACAGRPAAR